MRDGDDIAVLSIGPIGNEVIKAIEMVKEEGVSIAHYDMIYLKPLDEELLHEIGRKYNRIITVENGVIKVVLVALSLSLWQTMVIRLM